MVTAMYERMVSWMRMCLHATGEWMEWMWLCCTGSVQHRLKTELFSVTMRHIYTKIRVRERGQEREVRENTGIKSVRLEGCFRLWLAWTDGKDTNNNKQPTAHFPTTLHLIWIIFEKEQCYQNNTDVPMADTYPLCSVRDYKIRLCQSRFLCTCTCSSAMY